MWQERPSVGGIWRNAASFKFKTCSNVTMGAIVITNIQKHNVVENRKPTRDFPIPLNTEYSSIWHRLAIISKSNYAPPLPPIRPPIRGIRIGP